MNFVTICIILLIQTVSSKHMLHYEDLDQDEQIMFRAMYKTLYKQNYYNEEGNYSAEKLDQIKDGLWAITEKLKEIEAFNQALAANILATKLKLEELFENNVGSTKGHKHVNEKKKYFYDYLQPHYHSHYGQQQDELNNEDPPQNHDPYHGM